MGDARSKLEQSTWPDEKRGNTDHRNLEMNGRSPSGWDLCFIDGTVESNYGLTEVIWSSHGPSRGADPIT